MTTIPGREPQRFDAAQVAQDMSNGLAEWAMSLLAVPMLATVAAAHSSDSFGVVLCRVLETRCVLTFDEVMEVFPSIFDADQDGAVGAVELIEARADDLLGQAMGLAAL